MCRTQLFVCKDLLCTNFFLGSSTDKPSITIQSTDQVTNAPSNTIQSTYHITKQAMNGDNGTWFKKIQKVFLR